MRIQEALAQADGVGTARLKTLETMFRSLSEVALKGARDLEAVRLQWESEMEQLRRVFDPVEDTARKSKEALGSLDSILGRIMPNLQALGDRGRGDLAEILTDTTRPHREYVQALKAAAELLSGEELHG